MPTGSPGMAAILVAAVLSGEAAAAELVPRGTYVWSEQDDAFGGFSGLVMAPDGRSFYAVSDQGELFHAVVMRDGAEQIERISADWHARLIDNYGDAVDRFTADAEGLARARDGSLYVAYESYSRITEVRPPDMHPIPLHPYERFKDLWTNESFEGVAERPDGGPIVIVEKPDSERAL